MNALKKISIGKSEKKKSVFDLSFDASTTANWGFIAPLTCREIIPDSSISTSVDAFVRLRPLPTPTFGRASYKVFHSFVPMSDIYHIWPHFISQTDWYSPTLNQTYVPSEVPHTSSRELLHFVTKGAVFNAYEVTQEVSTDRTDSLSGLTQVPSVEIYSKVIASGLSADWFNPSAGFQPGLLPSGSDFVRTVKVLDKTYVVCCKLEAPGSNLFKIMLGLGYKPDVTVDDDTQSILKLVAYYKAYFDLFVPKREVNWHDTAAYQLMEYIIQNNVKVIHSGNTAYGQLLEDFLLDLSTCYYSENPDYFSAQLTDMASSQASRSISAPGYNSGNVTVSQLIPDNLPFVQSNTNRGLDAVRLRLLNILTKFTNKSSVIGAKIDAYMKAHYGVGLGHDNETSLIGAQTYDITISDVMNQAETIEGSLGEYAGRGVGYGSGKNFSFHTNDFGYYLCFATVVPKGSYCQGSARENSHITPFDYYTPEFDAVGMQVCGKSEIFQSSDVSSYHEVVSGQDGFGYIPRYSEYKVSQNLLSGGFARLSQRSELLPYTLDKIITPSSLEQIYSEGDLEEIRIHKTNRDNFVAGPAWRFVGRYDWRGNFNRIFYVTGDSSDTRSNLPADIDNFICHNIVNLRVTSPMLPLSHSWDTFDEENDHGDINVHHQ